MLDKHESVQGSQYTSIDFGNRCRVAGVRPSTGSVGDCYDNAMCESFFATLECELLDRRRFRSHAEARMAVFEFIEGWYNPAGGTRPSAICHLSTTKGASYPPLAQIHNRPRNRGNSRELDDADKAERLMRNLARRLEMEAPDVSKSILEGIDEILTVVRLGLPLELRRSLASMRTAEQ